MKGFRLSHGEGSQRDIEVCSRSTLMAIFLCRSVDSRESDRGYIATCYDELHGYYVPSKYLYTCTVVARELDADLPRNGRHSPSLDQGTGSNSKLSPRFRPADMMYYKARLIKSYNPLNVLSDGTLLSMTMPRDLIKLPCRELQPNWSWRRNASERDRIWQT